MSFQTGLALFAALLCIAGCQPRTTVEEAPTCLLGPAALEDRLDEIHRLFEEHCESIVEIPNGFTMRFSGGSEAHAAVEEIVRKERECCPFLTWDLTAAESEKFSLEVTGSPEAKELVRSYLEPLLRE